LKKVGEEASEIEDGVGVRITKMIE